MGTKPTWPHNRHSLPFTAEPPQWLQEAERWRAWHAQSSPEPLSQCFSEFGAQTFKVKNRPEHLKETLEPSLHFKQAPKQLLSYWPVA